MSSSIYLGTNIECARLEIARLSEIEQRILGNPEKTNNAKEKLAAIETRRKATIAALTNFLRIQEKTQLPSLSTHKLSALTILPRNQENSGTESPISPASADITLDESPLAITPTSSIPVFTYELPEETPTNGNTAKATVTSNVRTVLTILENRIISFIITRSPMSRENRLTMIDHAFESARISLREREVKTKTPDLTKSVMDELQWQTTKFSKTLSSGPFLIELSKLKAVQHMRKTWELV
ncbi:MAG: hypothetical protein KGZ39_04385 [Simkania sp.]|nr:hypothetical protein [Simkania sp.]